MNPARGVSAFVDGARICRSAGLTRYVWLPTLISFVVIAIGLYFTFDYLTGVADVLGSRLPGWLAWLEVLLRPLLYLLGVLIGAWSFAFLAVLISSPFLGAFSAAVERTRYGKGPGDGTTSLWTDLTDSIGREARKLAYHLPRLLVVAVLTLIPVINVASPVIWLVFGAWTMAVQFVDYPAENRRLPFLETLVLLRANRGAALLFGACVSATLAIPFVNFLLIPIAVAGGTLFWNYASVGEASSTAINRSDAR